MEYYQDNPCLGAWFIACVAAENDTAYKIKRGKNCKTFLLPKDTISGEMLREGENRALCVCEQDCPEGALICENCWKSLEKSKCRGGI